MEVTEHNIRDHRLTNDEIDELIYLVKQEITDDMDNQWYYGMIIGKLIIMKT